MELCVALDLDKKDSNLYLLEELKEFDNIWVKVGFRSFIRDGEKLIENIKNINSTFKIFLDLKLYDIPNTMADASVEIAKMGIDMFNIHASSGYVAMQTVMDRLATLQKRPLVLAVTVLTSFDNDSFKEIYSKDIETKAIEFAKESFRAKLDGVVCSAFESRFIKQHTSDTFITLTPGIRPFGEDSQDQKRVANLAMAHEQNVDIIVVGRPIYQAPNPKDVVKHILTKL